MKNGNGAELTSGAAVVSTATLEDGIVGVPVPGVANDALVFVCHRTNFGAAIGILSAYIDAGTLVIESSSPSDASVVNFCVFNKQTLAQPPPSVPTAPTGVHYHSIDNDILDWTANPNPLVWFEVEQNFERGSDWTASGTTAKGATDTNGLAIDPDGDISHRVRAIDEGVAGAWGYPVPKAPSDLNVSSFNANDSRNLAWLLKGTDPQFSTGVEVWRKVGAGAYAVKATLAGGLTEYSDTEDLSGNEGSELSYKVKELSSLGNSEFSNEVSDTIPV